MEDDQDRGWDARDDRMAKSQGTTLQKTFRVGHPPSYIRVASGSKYTDTPPPPLARRRGYRYGRVRIGPSRSQLGTHHHLFDWSRRLSAPSSTRKRLAEDQ